jgi:hypothetical protein
MLSYAELLRLRLRYVELCLRHSLPLFREAHTGWLWLRLKRIYV